MRIKWHYKDSLFLMLIGFLVAFAAFVDVGYMIFQNQTYSELSSRYTYANSTLLDASDEQGIDFEAFATKKGNLSISSMTTMLDEGQQHYMLTIAMKQNEPYQYQLLEGAVEEPDDTSVPVAVIGKSLKPYTFMRKGQRYIMLEGDAYKVIGITGNAYCEYNDSELLVFYHALGKNLKRSLQSQTTVQFRLQSNECDTYEEAMQLYETVTQKQPSLNCSLTALENVTYDQGMDDFRSIVDILLFLFCLINCVVVSIYWMQKRRREIAVRRLYDVEGIAESDGSSSDTSCFVPCCVTRNRGAAVTGFFPLLSDPQWHIICIIFFDHKCDYDILSIVSCAKNSACSGSI